jgi:hypothetical protein
MPGGTSVVSDLTESEDSSEFPDYDTDDSELESAVPEPAPNIGMDLRNFLTNYGEQKQARSVRECADELEQIRVTCQRLKAELEKFATDPENDLLADEKLARDLALPLERRAHAKISAVMASLNETLSTQLGWKPVLNQKCYLCYEALDAESARAWTPCGHMVCATCAGKLQGKCGVCRTNGKQLKLFFA